ncbi:MAG: hypothetical protein JSS50_02670 [Proteobacteria bacterium]|nr:hypothetical protein [Pseudomonadota bacterium]
MRISDKAFKALYEAYKSLDNYNSQKLLRDNLDFLITVAKQELQDLADGKAQYFFSDDVTRASPKATVLLALLGYDTTDTRKEMYWDTTAPSQKNDKARKKWLGTLTPLQRGYIGEITMNAYSTRHKENANTTLRAFASSVEAPHQSWVRRSQVSTLFNARFVAQMHAQAEEGLKNANIEPSLNEVAKANLTGLFTTLVKNFESGTPSRFDGFPNVENAVGYAYKVLLRRPDWVHEGEEIKYGQPANGRVQYITEAYKVTSLQPALQKVLQKYRMGAPEAEDLHSNMRSAHDGNNVGDIIRAQRIYVEMLDVYAKHLRSQPGPENQQKYAALQEHISDRKAKLYALEMVYTRSDTMAAAIWKRAKGASVGALPGLITTAGGAIGLACDDEVKKVAMEALQDVGEGLFDKFREGLVAGNPILVSLIVGLCLGALGAFIGAVSAAEAAAHYKHQPEAIKYFEKMLLNNAKQMFPETEL